MYQRVRKGTLRHITKAFFKSERRVRARGLLTLLLMLSLAFVGVTVLMSYVGRDLITAIEKKDIHAYWSSIGRHRVEPQPRLLPQQL